MTLVTVNTYHDGTGSYLKSGGPVGITAPVIQNNQVIALSFSLLLDSYKEVIELGL